MVEDQVAPKEKGTLAGAEAHMVSFSERQSLVDVESFEELGKRYRNERN